MAEDMTNEEWNALWAGALEVVRWFPEGCAFIGGLAVHPHCQHHDDMKDLAALSHDGDFAMMRANFVDLVDIVEVMSNRRLDKHRFTKNGFEFNVYAEGASSLVVPSEEIVAAASSWGGLRVACPEHLLTLKLEAYADKRGGKKGEKDAEDVVRIVALFSHDPIHAHRLRHMPSDHVELLENVRKSPAMLRLANGNPHEARKLGQVFEDGLKKVEGALNGPGGPGQRNNGPERSIMDRMAEEVVEADAWMSTLAPMPYREQPEGRPISFMEVCGMAGIASKVTTPRPTEIRSLISPHRASDLAPVFLIKEGV